MPESQWVTHNYAGLLSADVSIQSSFCCQQQNSQGDVFKHSEIRTDRSSCPNCTQCDTGLNTWVRTPLRTTVLDPKRRSACKKKFLVMDDCASEIPVSVIYGLIKAVESKSPWDLDLRARPWRSVWAITRTYLQSYQDSATAGCDISWANNSSRNRVKYVNGLKFATASATSVLFALECNSEDIHFSW